MDLGGITAVSLPRARAELPAWHAGMAVLGGGTWLFSEPQPGVTALVDLAGMGWEALRVSDAGLHIAATCRIAELARFAAPAGWLAWDIVQPCCEALLGSFKIWNAATVGGNICLALPAGPMTALAVALDGRATIWCPDGRTREMAVADLVIGDHRNALAEGEILRAVLLPAAALRRRTALRRQSLTPLGRSAALVIGTRDAGGFTLTVTAATPRPVRLDFPAVPEAAVLSAAIEDAVTARGLWFDDLHGAPDWRRHITLLFAEEIRKELAG